MLKNKLIFVVTLLSISLMLGACAKAPSKSEPSVMPGYYDSWSSNDNYYEEPMAEESIAGGEESGFPSGLGAVGKEIERMVIYNADMRIAVEDPEAVMQTIIKMVTDSGGFMVSSNVYRVNTSQGNLPQVSLMVRVPAGRLNSIMESIRGLTINPKDDVLSENISGQDVTAEYTDLDSRLRNLEAAEKALVELMKQAQDPQDVLDVFTELTYYRGEIEVVKGRMRYLEESSAMSALTIDIVAKRSLQPIEIIGWEPKGTVKDAVEALINAGQGLVDALIWFGIFCLPFLIPVGLAVFFLVRFIIKQRAQKKAKKVDVETIDSGGQLE